MPKIVCVECEREYVCEENSINVADVSEQIEQVWSADLWKCPKCGHQIVAGVASKPFLDRHERYFTEKLTRLGRIYRNYGRRS